jgi:hypothetical protein
MDIWDGVRQGWGLVRAHLALRAHRSRPRGEAQDARPLVRPVDGSPGPGWEDNGLFVDITGIPIVGIDAVVGNMWVE